MKINYLNISVLLVGLMVFLKLFWNPKNYTSITILGNSIVQHPPDSSIGWLHNHGMAASEPDSDFVHILERNLKSVNPNIKIKFVNIADFEIDLSNYNISNLNAFKDSDILIVKLSENMNYEGPEKLIFDRYDTLCNSLCPSHKVVIVGGFWPKKIVNKYLESYAKSRKYPFVANIDLFSDSSNCAYGLYKHEGIQGHPSNKGMRKIAERIFEATKPLLK